MVFVLVIVIVVVVVVAVTVVAAAAVVELLPMAPLPAAATHQFKHCITINICNRRRSRRIFFFCVLNIMRLINVHVTTKKNVII